MIVIRQLKEGRFCSNRARWLYIAAFRIILYMAHRKIVFGSGVKALLDVPELCIEKLEKSSVEKVLKESFLIDTLE